MPTQKQIAQSFLEDLTKGEEAKLAKGMPKRNLMARRIASQTEYERLTAMPINYYVETD